MIYGEGVSGSCGQLHLTFWEYQRINPPKAQHAAAIPYSPPSPPRRLILFRAAGTQFNISYLWCLKMAHYTMVFKDAYKYRYILFADNTS
jgi:hypothetical protein